MGDADFFTSVLNDVFELDGDLMYEHKVHIGKGNYHDDMARYINRPASSPGGGYVIDLFKAWDKLHLAARAIAAVPPDECKNIFVLSKRPCAQTAMEEFAKHIGATYIDECKSPDAFTRKLHSSDIQPCLLIVADSKTDRKAVKEAFLSDYNIPIIALAETDASLRFVDICIPENLTSKHSIGCLFWLLARMVCQMHGQIPQGPNWDVPTCYFIIGELSLRVGRFVAEHEDEGAVDFPEKEEEDDLIDLQLQYQPKYLLEYFSRTDALITGPEGSAPAGDESGSTTDDIGAENRPEMSVITEGAPRVIVDFGNGHFCDMGYMPGFVEWTPEEYNKPLSPPPEGCRLPIPGWFDKVQRKYREERYGIQN